MLHSLSRTLRQPGFWLSLLLHAALFLYFSLQFSFFLHEEEEKKPGLYIPAYTYQPPQQTRIAETKSPKSPIQSQKKHLAEVKQPPRTERAARPKMATQATAMPLSSQRLTKQTEPVHLIGDKSVNKPLLTLLGKALAAHLIYPKAAVDFRIRGMVLVQFTLYPDGHMTDIKMVQSSKAGVLDEEAVLAVKAMSPVKNVKAFLQEPKTLVVGIIFG